MNEYDCQDVCSEICERLGGLGFDIPDDPNTHQAAVMNALGSVELVHAGQALMPEHPEDEGSSDYELAKDSCWITVKNLSVYIHQTDEGVSIEVYPKGKEDQDTTITQCWCLFQDAEQDEE